MHSVQFSTEDSAWTSFEPWMKSAMLSALRFLKIDSTEVSVSLVQTSTIHKLNKTYRNIDRPTDVLSFEQGDTHENLMLLGDIIIAPEIADQQTKQSSKLDWSFHKELLLLMLHGLLHLLGYDHATVEEEKEMFDLQDKILERILSEE